MFDTPKIQRDFSRAARTYDEHARLQQAVRLRAIGLIRDYWPDGTRILDVGCGTGALAREMPGWHITGLDLAPGMCDVARGHMAHVVDGDASVMPFADGAFGGLFSSLMLQWSQKPLGVLREMARVACPGSVSVVATLVHGTLDELRASIAAFDDAPHVSDFMPAPDIAASAVHAGFRLLEAEHQPVVEYYPGAVSLMRALKVIGAANKRQGRRAGLMTPRRLSALEKKYADAYGSKQGIKATWQVFYMVLEKV